MWVCLVISGTSEMNCITTANLYIPWPSHWTFQCQSCACSPFQLQQIELYACITIALNKLVASSMEGMCIGCFQDQSSIIIALEHHSSGPLQLSNIYFPELRGYKIVCCMLCLSHLFVGIFAIPRSRKYYLFWREVWPFHYKVYAGL